MKRATTTLCVLMLVALVSSTAFAEIKSRKVPGWDGIKPLKLEEKNIEFMLSAVRAMLKEKTTALPNAGVRDTVMPKALTELDGRWVFLTFFTSGHNPITIANHKHSIIESLAACVEAALQSKSFTSVFAPDKTRIVIDIPTIVTRVWPTTTGHIASEYDPSAFGLYVSDGSRRGFVLPVQYFASGAPPRDFRDNFIKRFQVEGRDFLKRGSSVFMFSLDTHIESAPRGISIPLVRGNLLRERASAEMMEFRALMAADFLIAHQADDGSFFNEYDPRKAIADTNCPALKIAEATVALEELAAYVKKERIRNSARRALSYLFNQVKAGRPGDERFLYVGDPQGVAELGTTATVTMAFALDASRTGKHDNDPIITGLLDFIVYMQVFNGDFRRYWPQPKQIRANPSLVSPYLGQAVCALIEGARRFPDKRRYAKAIDRSASLILKYPRDFMKSRIPVENAWFIRAVLELSRYYRSRPDSAKRSNEMLHLAMRYAANLLDRQYTSKDADFPDQVGGFRPYNKAAPDENSFKKLSAIERRLRTEPSALATAAMLEGLARAAVERTRVSVPPKRFLEKLQSCTDFIIREQYDEINTYYLHRPRSAIGGVRSTPDDATIRVETVALFIRGLLGARKVVQD